LKNRYDFLCLIILFHKYFETFIFIVHRCKYGSK
jgi:hypothetical protein